MKYLIAGLCVDNDGGNVDSNGNSCDWYAGTDGRGGENWLQCGFFDVELGRDGTGFTASEMCCACGYSSGISQRLPAGKFHIIVR